MRRVILAPGIGAQLTERLAERLDEAADWLSELDGATGDGDHGVNMRKGLQLARTRLGAGADLGTALQVVGDTLLDDVGGATGPLYGVFFQAAAATVRGRSTLVAIDVQGMLEAGRDAVVALGGAKTGDKTMVDVLSPALDAFVQADKTEGLGVALTVLAEKACQARDATAGFVARLGRASRLADRSLGHVDAGAASCTVILCCLSSVLSEHVQ